MRFDFSQSEIDQLLAGQRTQVRRDLSFLAAARKGELFFLDNQPFRVDLVLVENIQDAPSSSALAEAIGTTAFWSPANTGPYQDEQEFWEVYPARAYTEMWKSENGVDKWEENQQTVAFRIQKL